VVCRVPGERRLLQLTAVDVPEPQRRRLAVLGSPIAHSRSPQIHGAAYEMLGLDWSYERIEVAEGGLAAFIEGLDDSWRGFSVTMPLKAEALALSSTVTATANATNAVNTLRLWDDGVTGDNTDILGVIGALTDAGVEPIGIPLILGAGATAGSVVFALARMGFTDAVVAARRPQQAASVAAQAEPWGIRVAPIEWAAADGAALAATLVVNTVPGAAPALLTFDAEVRARTPLFEIVYADWPSALASSWLDAGGTVISGLEMLVHQALAQVRIFVKGDASAALPREHELLEAMRRAVAS